MVCPSNLGEYSLVRLLFFQNLHWVFGYGLQCLGLEEFSSNILVSETCDFFYTISFCRFSNFKNLSSPELALMQGAFSQNFGILSRHKFKLLNFLQLRNFKTFTFSKNLQILSQSSPWSDNSLTRRGVAALSLFLLSDSEICLFTPCEFGE